MSSVLSYDTVKTKAAERAQTPPEEIANAVSHGIGFVACLVAAPSLIEAAVRHGGSATVIGASVFAVTAALLYLSSTIYHALPHGETKELFDMIDHSAIFLLIAGSYTPFLLGALRGTIGWILFGVIWILALCGVTMKMRRGVRNKLLSTALYIGMGWLVVVAARPLLLHVPLNGLLLLLAGGIAYTAGTAFYLAKHVPYCHFVWHLFVLAGTTCHYMAVFWYAAPVGK